MQWLTQVIWTLETYGSVGSCSRQKNFVTVLSLLMPLMPKLG